MASSPPALGDGDGDGRVSVSLAELIALRSRVGKPALPQLPSRAARSGQQGSRLLGRGMDYAESRAYQGGDDVRRLDWRLTARSGKLHTKLFQEEREGQLLVLLDTHAGMHFGTRVRFKSVQSARAAAWAAWLSVRASERVSMLGFGELDQMLPPRAGARGALAVCGALADWYNRPLTQRREPLSDALLRAGRLRHGVSRILLISDGGCSDAAAHPRLINLQRHARLAVLAVGDALELQSAPPGRYPFEHDGQRCEVSLQTERQRARLQQTLGAGHARLLAMANALALPCRSIDTATDPFEAVAALLGLPRSRR